MNIDEFYKLGFKETMSSRYVALTINEKHQICKFKVEPYVTVYIGKPEIQDGVKYIGSTQIQMTKVNTIDKLKQLIKLLQNEN